MKILQSISNMKKVYVVFALIAVFLIAGYASAYNTMSLMAAKKAKTKVDSGQIALSQDSMSLDAEDTNNDSQDEEIIIVDNNVGTTPEDKSKAGSTKKPTATPKIAKYSLVLSAVVGAPQNGPDASVTYTVALKENGKALSKPISNVKVDFLTTATSSSQDPDLYVGSAILDAMGNGRVVIKQDPGTYSAQAKLVNAQYVNIKSDIIKYTINSMEKPKLDLKVDVINKFMKLEPHNIVIDPIVDPGYEMIPNYTVVFTAKVVIPDRIQSKVNLNEKIDIQFYSSLKNQDTGKLVGTASLVNGIATLKIKQLPGIYNASALWISTPWGKISSSFVSYKVPNSIKPSPFPLPIETLPPVHPPYIKEPQF